MYLWSNLLDIVLAHLNIVLRSSLNIGLTVKVTFFCEGILDLRKDVAVEAVVVGGSGHTGVN